MNHIPTVSLLSNVPSVPSVPDKGHRGHGDMPCTRDAADPFAGIVADLARRWTPDYGPNREHRDRGGAQ